MSFKVKVQDCKLLPKCLSVEKQKNRSLMYLVPNLLSDKNFLKSVQHTVTPKVKWDSTRCNTCLSNPLMTSLNYLKGTGKSKFRTCNLGTPTNNKRTEFPFSIHFIIQSDIICEKELLCPQQRLTFISYSSFSVDTEEFSRSDSSEHLT